MASVCHVILPHHSKPKSSCWGLAIIHNQVGGGLIMQQYESYCGIISQNPVIYFIDSKQTVWENIFLLILPSPSVLDITCELAQQVGPLLL